jgi:hypothetical protein
MSSPRAPFLDTPCHKKIGEGIGQKKGEKLFFSQVMDQFPEMFVCDTPCHTKTNPPSPRSVCFHLPPLLGKLVVTRTKKSHAKMWSSILRSKQSKIKKKKKTFWRREMVNPTGEEIGVPAS